MTENKHDNNVNNVNNNDKTSKPLFIDPKDSQESKFPKIFLIDASGSVTNDFSKQDKTTIHQKIKEWVIKLAGDNVRLIFWNSVYYDRNCEPAKFFKTDVNNNGKTETVYGVYRLPAVVKKESINQFFSLVVPKINGPCYTMPHLGFDAIPDEWINKNGPTDIYLITDGEICSDEKVFSESQLKTMLGDSIQQLVKKHNDIHLNIVTVEYHNRDYTNIEAMQGAAGSDVFEVIKSRKLTGLIDKFISVTPNNLNGFNHINKVVAPPGHLPYGPKYFSELRIGEFISYLKNEITKIASDNKDNKEVCENKLITVVQDLSPTLARLTKDKPPKRVSEIVQIFSNLFTNTVLDPMFVKIMLDGSVANEHAGQANIFANYRKQLSQLYTLANDLLFKNVKEAIGIYNKFLTFPMNNTIVAGNFRLIDKTISNGRTIYPQSGILLNSLVVPVLPLLSESKESKINEQCIRQWTRFVIGTQYGLNVMDDIIIYFVMALTMKVVISNVNDSVKNSYRKLSNIMLQKKRLRVDTTEYQYLAEGNLPNPNSSGKIDDFYFYMTTISNKLGLTTKLSPMSLWYLICLTFGDKVLCTKQYPHCRDSLEKDFPNIKDGDYSKCPTVLQKELGEMKFVDLPDDMVLDYSQCLVTLEDVTKTGGYKFLPHQDVSGKICSPVYVLSTEGYNALTADISKALCPVCYAQLTANNFAKVGPQTEVKEQEIFNKFFVDANNIFAKLNNNNVNNNVNNSVNAKEIKESKDCKKIVVRLRGDVGSGKSTWSLELKKQIESLGGYCMVTGTDKFCKDGTNINTAINYVNQEIEQAKRNTNKLKVLVIDTCGEQWNPRNVFNSNLSDWKSIVVSPNLYENDMKGYCSWSLYNVLLRKKPTANDNHNLNPETAGVGVCISVHAKKGKNLFQKKYIEPLSSQYLTLEQAINELKSTALAYQNKLESVEKVVSRFIEKNFK